ncbi:MAG TPA: alpha/beta hydrolase [Burkholderiales bacterium]|nr:alpha/beta hydrolase [Burkholderiales bacterium]
MRIVEAGVAGRPPILLLHGFPELAYSWRKVMPALAAAGFHVIAPDQRGYGETTGWDNRYDTDLERFRVLNLVEDVAQLLARLGLEQVHVVGHDFGSPVAACCALAKPQLFRSVVLMSAPVGGIALGSRDSRVHDDLAKLGRKHYQWYYSTREADANMRRAPAAFLRAYYHYKSADWPGNEPFPLKDWSAVELAKLPTYYVMELDKGMAETVAPYAPASASPWLTDVELAVYAESFQRTGFQGGLNWYRCATSPQHTAAVGAVVGGRKIDAPSMFIAGAADWGIYQKPGEFERMQTSVCTDFRGAHLVPGAGHWVQQEQPERTAELLINFLRAT